MIFEEVEDGMNIWIPHKEMMNKDTDDFVSLILHARSFYKRHANADVDDDNSDGERYRSRNLDVVILESSHRHQTVY